MFYSKEDFYSKQFEESGTNGQCLSAAVCMHRGVEAKQAVQGNR